MVKIDKEKCVGCGLCISICKEAFKMGKNGKAEVKSQNKAKCVKDAIESCPVDAISE